MFRRVFALFSLLCSPLCAAEKFRPYADPDFPILTSTVDFSGWKKFGFPEDNIAVRGLIIKLPHDLYVCFDQDLLRVAGIWQGEPGGKFLTFTTIPAISYNTENKKSEGGQKDLPKPIGKPLMATGLMPGWILEDAKDVTPEDLKDPRPPGPDPKEPGRGPLPAKEFQWIGYAIEDDGVSLSYECGDARIQEAFEAGIVDGLPVVQRTLTILDKESLEQEGAPRPAKKPLTVIHGMPGKNSPQPAAVVNGTSLVSLSGEVIWFLYCTLHDKDLPSFGPGDFVATIPNDGLKLLKAPPVRIEAAAGGEGKTIPSESAFRVEEIPIPIPNPWKRNVRPSGIAFFPDGRAVVCTIDGDLWIVSGLEKDAAQVEWQRFASGLHEPQSVAVDDGLIYVFTRDGILYLDDSPTSFVQVYSCWSNAFTQTGETREYPMDMVAKPGGGFYIAKGGQMLTRKTPQGGRVLEISADGRTVTEVCTGLRQPYLGIHPKTGLLTASDQQGHWTPSTPIRYIRQGAYYGFEEAAPNPVPAAVEPPACWIPHEVNQSAAGQVWAVDAKMGVLNERLLHLMYFRPGILAAFLDERQKQAATVPTGLTFDFPLLKGAINPVDGMLYVVGFRIWGTESKNMAGMARIRPTGKPSPLPIAVRAVPQGVHLRFTEKIDAASLRPEQFTASRWNYKRTSGYGSAHYKLDGTPGVEPLPCTGVQLSTDGLGILIHLPDMKPAEQYRLDWRMKSAAGMKMESFTCLTLYALEPFDAPAAGFDPAFKPKAAAEMTAVAAQEPSSAEAGQKLVTQLGCLACHSTNGSMEGMKGPTWKDLSGGAFTLEDGSQYKADAAWLRESILNPAAKVRKGFRNGDVGMPPYAGILSDSQVESILLYLRSLSVHEVR